jgi:hypothetical protein
MGTGSGDDECELHAIGPTAAAAAPRIAIDAQIGFIATSFACREPSGE